MNAYVAECVVNYLSLDRALKLVPPEFSQAYDWFSNNVGERIPALPMGRYKPKGFGFPLARQSGIHSPSYNALPSKGAHSRKYALSIHSQGHTYYDDADVIRREDGTWIFDYQAHRRLNKLNELDGDRGQDYNEQLMNCMFDGVPVGVMIKQHDNRGGYLVLGLAYIERYNELTDTFTLHGPVNSTTETAGLFFRFDQSQMTIEQIKTLIDEDQEDTRIRITTEQVKRQQQSLFRQKVAAAYGGSCALTEVDIQEVLQAAHIDPYRGPKSQIVCNGMLLRADIHLLYDAHLATVEPVTYVFRIAPKLRSSKYSYFDGTTINVPRCPAERPNDTLLGYQYKQFCMQKAIST